MSKQTKDMVLQLLPTLSSDELSDVLSAAQGLAKTPTTREIADLDLRAGMLRDAVARALISTVRQRIAPYNVVKKTPLGKAYRDASACIDKHVALWLAPSRVKNTQRLSAYRLFAQLTTDWLIKSDIPPSPISICRNVERFPGLFDLAFPGYANKRLAALIFDPTAGL